MKSVSLQSFSAFLLVSIEKLGGPFWHVDIQVCMSFDRIVHNFAPGIFVWLRPDREAKFSSRSQDTKCFRACFFRRREMEQPKVHQDAIIARIIESQLLRIAFPKSDFGKHAAGDCRNRRPSGSLLLS